MVFAMPQQTYARDLVFAEIIVFAKSHRGNSPGQRELWRILKVKKYGKEKKGYSWKYVRDLLEQLQNHGKIQIIDKEIVIPKSSWELLEDE